MRSLNKKGFMDMEAFFYIIAFLFATVIFIVLLFYIWGQVSPNLETGINDAIPDGSATYNISTTNDQVNTGVTIFNVMFPLLIIGLLIFTLIMAFNTNSGIMFFFISVGIMVVVIILGVVFSNIYQNLTTTTPLADSSNTLGIMKIFMDNFPTIVMILFGIMMLVLFISGRSGGGGL